MGVIYKILKQQRQQQQQQQQQHHNNNRDLSTATKCKVQAAIKQRQLQRQQEQQEQQDTTEDAIAEQQLQQLYRFLSENATRKKRQRLRLQHMTGDDAEHPLCELQAAASQAGASATTTHDMDLLMEHLNTCTSSGNGAVSSSSPPSSSSSSAAPRDSILLKIRHQIFERKRQQRQRQLAELVQQRLVVWRPW
ncbi:hypothetical protein KR044_007830 [Drosophila immigrans]|nr:hypothetical protein KR044_007830 [Drosophila immigrans]